ncbi:UNKNOWN [Stylonychia lemnae]|uniref:Uncharacterized protein n=1 Tax=Stylonychia lemnae TaxID=5949 RepID=A0A078B1C3_STYLE|nr:UNKNOWN [Stylonychia lemnae]|eukprot:CDW87152.1 UNKNOWN [Stylonychia lemnae]
MQLYLAYFAISCIKNAIKLYHLQIKKIICRHIHQIQWAADILAFVTMIVLHCYRLSHSGKVCSGTFRLSNDNSEHYLTNRGLLLLAHIVMIWLVLIAQFIVVFTYRVILRP